MTKNKWLIAMLVLFFVVGLALLWPGQSYLPTSQPPWIVERLAGQPIIAEVAEEHGYYNVCCPSIIEVPDWVQNRLGRYYLYFSHHKGSYIRMAYSNSPLGPWSLYEEGVLSLGDSGLPVSLDEVITGESRVLYTLRTLPLPLARDILVSTWWSKRVSAAERKKRGMSAAGTKTPHIASPEVVADDVSRQLVLFYHGLDHYGRQSSRIATSSSGLEFTGLEREVAGAYLRHFQHHGIHYLLGMAGALYRSDSLTGPYELRNSLLFEPNMRHPGLWLEDDMLYVFWSRLGDAPERLLLSEIDLSQSDWNRWRATEAVEMLRPEDEWEGAQLPVHKSIRGELDIPSQELRDPFLFRDSDGAFYLYYVGGGERGIGAARLLQK
ncbi:hypothetical protein CWI75_05330 [Kineobactrum sediminis]|uniref:Uncharacterized protein n=1 Tax=Kineobactrum sediminis TaxID=1905677 RepID=A0A2N5Y3A3_9GAMM|nr:hypothetical protein [Kineobactrum sediminis]PLW82873.1 hypothetical protein CWI75_05330 [Kineobactrum sediminis]